LAVLISGNGSNLQAIIDAIQEQRLAAEIVVVVANRREAFGLQRAQRAGIPTRYHPLKPYRELDSTCSGHDRRAYDADLAQIVLAYQPDYVVLAGWMHILSNAFLQHFPNRVINLHPALPGQFPGAHAIEEALVAYGQGKITHTGVMVHFVPDEGVDCGPLLGTVEVAILPTDTLESLAERIHQHEYELLVAVLANLK
jgi:phosphoribosylglycinamide formyltransferase 1